MKEGVELAIRECHKMRDRIASDIETIEKAHHRFWTQEAGGTMTDIGIDDLLARDREAISILEGVIDTLRKHTDERSAAPL